MLWTGSNVSLSPRTLLPRLLLRATRSLLLSISLMHQSNPTVPSPPFPGPLRGITFGGAQLVLTDALNGELARRLIRQTL